MTLRIQMWLYHHTEGVAGFISGSVVVTSVVDFARTVLETLILALLSGALGALGAHYMKKFLTKRESKNENT